MEVRSPRWKGTSRQLGGSGFATGYESSCDQTKVHVGPRLPRLNKREFHFNTQHSEGYTCHVPIVGHPKSIDSGAAEKASSFYLRTDTQKGDHCGCRSSSLITERGNPAHEPGAILSGMKDTDYVFLVVCLTLGGQAHLAGGHTYLYIPALYMHCIHVQAQTHTFFLSFFLSLSICIYIYTSTYAHNICTYIFTRSHIHTFTDPLHTSTSRRWRVGGGRKLSWRWIP